MQKYTSLIEKMKDLYLDNPTYAVRSKKFVGMLEQQMETELWSKITENGKSELKIQNEAIIFQDDKNKNIDIVLSHPINGPLITIGVRTQMSNIAKNTLTYFQEIRGECLGLQTRYPMSVHGYIYLHPKRIINTNISSSQQRETVDHDRYAKLFSTISGRSELSDIEYKNFFVGVKGVFDHFSYFVVDFEKDPISYNDDWSHLTDIDMSIDNFIDNLVNTAKKRFHFTNFFI